jgi:hypothetical protein
MGKNPDPGLTSPIRNTKSETWFKQQVIFNIEFLRRVLLLVVAGSEIRDPGWEKSGSGINIPDSQH